MGTDDHWHSVVGSADLLNFSKTRAGNSRAGRLHVGKDDRWAIPSSLSRGNGRVEIKFYQEDDGVAAVPSQSSACNGQRRVWRRRRHEERISPPTKRSQGPGGEDAAQDKQKQVIGADLD